MRCTCCPPARHAGRGWCSGARQTRLPTGRTGRPCELRRRLVAPFGGRLRKIDIQSCVQARYLRKHRPGRRFQDRVLALVGLACSGLPNMLVSRPRYGVGFRSTSRRRAYRNSDVLGGPPLRGFRSTSRRRAYRNGLPRRSRQRRSRRSEAPHAEGRIETLTGLGDRAVERVVPKHLTPKGV